MVLARALVSAAAGCAGAAITGGKCAEAAVTAAFGSMFNGDMARHGYNERMDAHGMNCSPFPCSPGNGYAGDGGLPGDLALGGLAGGIRSLFARGAAALAGRTAAGEAAGALAPCSFDGDTRVKTRRGMVPIRDLKEGEEAYSRDKQTGHTGWRQITATHNRHYAETVTITIRDTATGAQQSIVSNRAHPYYVFVGAIDFRLVVNGYAIPGTNDTGSWTEAQHLKAGDRLIDESGNFAEVALVTIAEAPLTAYNLTVDDFHTYFVSGADNDNAPAVWVQNCFMDVKGVTYVLTDAMKDKAFTAFMKDVAANGIKNPVITVIEHNGTNYVVHGSNRMMAAARLGLTDQLQFVRTQLPFLGYTNPSHLTGITRIPRVR